MAPIKEGTLRMIDAKFNILSPQLDQDLRHISQETAMSTQEFRDTCSKPVTNGRPARLTAGK